MEALQTIDFGILIYIKDYVRTPTLTAIFKFITGLGNLGFVWLAIAIGLSAMKKTRVVGVSILLALVLEVICSNLILKNLVHRTRPFIADADITNLVKALDYSFPSGHTGSSFAAATVLWLNYKNVWAVLAIILAILISFSRIYLGVHYPSDLLGGLIIGVLVGWISYIACKDYMANKIK